MRSVLINKTSPFVDVVDQLTGTWNEFDRGEFRIVVTPFYTVLSATLDAGSHALPFKVTIPVAATVFHDDKTIEACIVKPGQTAVNLTKPGIFQLLMFGEQAKIT